LPAQLRARILGSRLLKDTSWTFGLKVLATGLGFLVSVVLARSLRPEGYGVYAYALALVTLLALPSQIGLPALLVRETARGQALEKPELVRGVWVWAGRVTGVLSITLTVGAAIVLLFANRDNFSDEAWTMLWAFLLVPLVSLGNLRGAALRGLDKVLAGQLPEFVLRPAFQLVLAGGLLLTAGAITAPQAMALHVVAAALAFGAGAWLLWRNTPPTVRTAVRRFETRAWLSSAWPLALIAGIATINSQVDILVLGLFEPTDQVGIYKVATHFAIMAAFGLQAVNLVVAPRIARLHALDQGKQLQRLVTGGARLALLVSAGITVVMALLGDQLIEIAYGTAFSAAYVPLLIMLVGQLINSATGSAGHLLNMTGNERESAKATVAAVMCGVALCLILIPPWGLIGAAIAYASSISIQNIWLSWMARRRLGIDSTAWGKGRAVIPSSPPVPPPPPLPQDIASSSETRDS
jgi:O-antigen/teichoic acid export membrane protein